MMYSELRGNKLVTYLESYKLSKLTKEMGKSEIENSRLI